MKKLLFTLLFVPCIATAGLYGGIFGLPHYDDMKDTSGEDRGIRAFKRDSFECEAASQTMQGDRTGNNPWDPYSQKTDKRMWERCMDAHDWVTKTKQPWN